MVVKVKEVLNSSWLNSEKSFYEGVHIILSPHSRATG